MTAAYYNQVVVNGLGRCLKSDRSTADENVMAFSLVRVAAICASAGYAYWRLKRDELDAERAAARDARQD